MANEKLIIGFLGLTGLGILGYSVMDDGSSLSTFTSVDKASTEVPVYTFGVTPSGVAGVSVDDEGDKENKKYEIEVPLSSINGTATTLDVAIDAKQLLADGQTISTDESMNHVFKFGYTSDVELENNDNDDVRLIDYSDSTINGEDISTSVGFLGSDSKTINYSIPLNPLGSDLFDIKQLEDSDDEYTVTLTNGFNTEIVLVFKNDQ